MKKLLLALLLVCFLAIPASVQADTSRVFISCSAAFIIPTDDGAGTYNPDFGVDFDGFYAFKEDGHVSFCGTYKSWRLKAEGSDINLSADYKGGGLVYWTNPNGAKANLGFMGGFGQAKIVEGNELTQDMSVIWAAFAKYRVFENIYLMGSLKVGGYGDQKHDAVSFSLGLGAPISF